MRETLFKVRINMLLTILYSYVKGYFIHRNSKNNLKERYTKSYNRYFIDLLKELWTTGTYDKKKYVKPSRTFTPRLKR